MQWKQYASGERQTLGGWKYLETERVLKKICRRFRAQGSKPVFANFWENEVEDFQHETRYLLCYRQVPHDIFIPRVFVRLPFGDVQNYEILKIIHFLKKKCCYDSVLICINDCLACLLCIVYCRDIN